MKVVTDVRQSGAMETLELAYDGSSVKVMRLF